MKNYRNSNLLSWECSEESYKPAGWLIKIVVLMNKHVLAESHCLLLALFWLAVSCDLNYKKCKRLENFEFLVVDHVVLLMSM